jgi:hypothetical protein
MKILMKNNQEMDFLTKNSKTRSFKYSLQMFLKMKKSLNSKALGNPNRSKRLKYLKKERKIWPSEQERA